MKLAALTLGLFACAVCGTARADGFFVDAHLGASNASDAVYDDVAISYAADAGYRWNLNPNVAVGVEGGYTRIGSFDDRSYLSHTFEFLGGFRAADIKGWTLGVNGHFNLTPQWYVSARGGYFRADVSGDYIISLPAGAVRVEGTSNKYYGGAGFGYDFSNNWSIGLNYDYYQADKSGLKLSPHLASLGTEFRF